jgi:hypothetical protein
LGIFGFTAKRSSPMGISPIANGIPRKEFPAPPIDFENKLSLMMPAVAREKIVDASNNQGGTALTGLEVFPPLKINAFHSENLINGRALLWKHSRAGHEVWTSSPIVTNLGAPIYFADNRMVHSHIFREVDKFTDHRSKSGWKMTCIHQDELQNNFSVFVAGTRRQYFDAK